MPELHLTVNGDSHALTVSPQLTLLEVLREHLVLTGTKEACGVGECGACVVLVDGVAVTSCLVLAADSAGTNVETIEGLAADGELTEIQEAFVDAGALQCGFCIPGMLMATTAMFRSGEPVEEEAVKDVLGGVLCRCGAYPKILEAVAEVGRSGK